MLNELYTKIEVTGLYKPVRLMQISDLHLTLADERDDAYANEHQIGRTQCFSRPGVPGAPAQLREMMAYAQDKCVDRIVLTGDILDFPSVPNLELLKEQLSGSGIPYFYIYGNHDWNYPRDMEQAAVKMRNTPLFKELLGGDASARAVDLGALILIGLDNSDYQFTDAQVDFTQAQLAAGKPCMIFFHVPLYIDTLLEDTMRVWQRSILAGTPPVCNKNDWGAAATEATMRMCRLLRKADTPLIGAAAGHVHFNHEDYLTYGVCPLLKNRGRKQYVTDVGAFGTVRIFDVVPA